MFESLLLNAAIAIMTRKASSLETFGRDLKIIDPVGV